MRAAVAGCRRSVGAGEGPTRSPYRGEADPRVRQLCRMRCSISCGGRSGQDQRGRRLYNGGGRGRGRADECWTLDALLRIAQAFALERVT